MRNISQLLFEDNVIRAGGPGQQVHKEMIIKNVLKDSCTVRFSPEPLPFLSVNSELDALAPCSLRKLDPI